MDNVLQNTIFDRYQTIIFDVDQTIMDAKTPSGDSIGVYQTTSPYKLQDSRTLVDIKGNTVELQEGVRELLVALSEEDKNLGILSRGEKLLDVNMRLSAPFESQPTTQILKKFDIFKYFNYSIIYKAFAEKIQYIRPSGLTLFIDDDRRWIDQVKQRDDVDVLWRGAFQSWDELVNETVTSSVKLSWHVQEDNFDRVEVGKDGTKLHYKGDKFHRLDGPAVENADGYKAWYQNGKRHRIDGPAIEWGDGTKHWFIDDKPYSKRKFNQKIEELNKLSWDMSHINLQKIEGDDPLGTFFIGYTRIPYEDLVRVLGEPTISTDSGRVVCQYVEWYVKTLDNQLRFTIYNDNRNGIFRGAPELSSGYKDVKYWLVGASDHKLFDAIDYVLQLNFNKGLYR